jgi:periplasmic divalent cation tolerance protein
MTSEYCIAMTTLEDEESASRLARSVVEAKLAACVQLIDIRSTFSWEGRLEDATEVLVLMKTRADVYERLQQFICDHHPYDVPEILQIPMTSGYGPYLSWLNDNTTSTV